MVEQAATPAGPTVIDSLEPGPSVAFVRVDGRTPSARGRPAGRASCRYGRRPVSASSSTTPSGSPVRPTSEAAKDGRRGVVVERILQVLAAVWAVLVVVLSL